MSLAYGEELGLAQSRSQREPHLKIFENFDFSESDVHMFCAGFVEAIFSEFARRRNKRRWAIKVPRMVEKMDYLSRLFPDAFFVHVIRDRRDVVASSLTKKRKHPTWYPHHEPEDFARDWAQMIGTARSHAKVLGRYHELHYEHLITDPRARMQEVLSFIDASWDEEVLRHHESGMISAKVNYQRLRSRSRSILTRLAGGGVASRNWS